METVCFTSDRRNWLLKGFAHQWQKYAPQIDVAIVGFTPPQFDIPLEFISLGKFEDYPIHRWSDALILYLTEFARDDYVTILLEDYWLLRPVNVQHWKVAGRAAKDLNAFRFDLTTDRINSGSVLQDVVRIEGVDIFRCPHSAYQMSMQASIFSREQLLSMLIPGETPWQVEIDGTGRLAKRPDLEVYGTRQWIFNYQIMVDKGQFKRFGAWMCPPRELSEEDFRALARLGYTEASV